jgi:xanthine dehydrogenase accessory factor
MASQHANDNFNVDDLTCVDDADQTYSPTTSLANNGTAMSDQQLLHTLTKSVASGRSAALVTVVATDRSVPRHAGAKMLVFADGTSIGSIGGGEMEARTIATSIESLRTGVTRRLSYNLVDAANGDPGVCGGSVELYVEPFMPTPTVYVVGCGHVGRAVVDLAKWLGFRVVATDDRPEAANKSELPNADVVIAGSISDALTTESIGAHTFVVVVTRNMKVDLALLPSLVASDAAFIGVMGSARRWEKTRAALIDQGVSAAQVDRVRSPIGVEINAETPQEIAVSVMAEVVAAQRSAAQPN